MGCGGSTAAPAVTPGSPDKRSRAHANGNGNATTTDGTGTGSGTASVKYNTAALGTAVAGGDTNRLIDLKQSADQKSEENVMKLLLLGSGESGKSTIFKQLNHIYNHTFNDDDARKQFRAIVHYNLLMSMKTLAEQTKVLGFPLRPENEDPAQQIIAFPVDASPIPVIFAHLKALWADPSIKQAYANRSKFQLYDTCIHLFERIDVIQHANYIPSYEDIIHVRARTSGIKETQFDIKGNRFRLLDVGGQKNERKKWIHSFEGVTAVLFVAAISEYDQTLYEDLKTNRMHDALVLFDDICNSKWFPRTSIILFLNKQDLFLDKIKSVDLRVCFPDYPGSPGDADAATEYISRQFLLKNRAPASASKQVYLHVTCATDQANIEFTFNAVKDIIIRDALKHSGLLD